MDDCSICFETITAETGHCTLGCSHTFHTACIGKWTINSTPSCPLCRKGLGETEIIPRPVTEIDIPMRQNTDVGYNDYFGLALSRRPVWMTIPVRSGQRQSILDNLNDLLHMTEVRVHIGNDITVSEADIRLVMERAEVSRSLAVQKLRENYGNVSESIYELNREEPDSQSPTPPTQDPLDPTEDMLTTWALERLFSKGSVLENHDVERVEDIRYRTSEVFRYGCWMNPEYKDIPKRRRADSF